MISAVQFGLSVAGEHSSPLPCDQRSLLLRGICLVHMNDVQILFHIQAVSARVVIDLMTAVVHGKANEGIVALPVLIDQTAQGREHLGVDAKLRQGAIALGTVVVHLGIVVSVVKSDEIVLILQDQLDRLDVGFHDALVDEIINVAFLIDARQDC